MIRPVFALTAGLLCALYGMRLSSALKDDERRLRRWTEVLRRLALIIAEQSVPLPEALKLAGDGDQQPDRMLHETSAILSSTPLSTLHDAFCKLTIRGPEQDTLLRMSRRLSRGSAESRSLAASQAAEETALMAENAALRAGRDARLFSTLGWTGGLCLSLLLL